MPTRLVFPEPKKVELETYELPAVKAGELRLATTCTLMSTGTENIVFNKLFEEGTGWANWAKYPFRPGYSAIGRVTELGEGVSTHKVGDLVAFRGSHCSDSVQPAARCWPVPAGVPADSASWFALAKIAAMGARGAEHKLGQSVVIIGAGPVGQMAIRWAAAAGCWPLIVVDAVPARLDLARRGGASHVIAKGIAEASDELKALTNGGPEVVIDSTGNHVVLPLALKLVRRFGRVVLLGDTGTPSQQHLTHDVLNRGLTICGVHDTHDRPGWDSDLIHALFFGLASSGRFSLANLITHRFKPAACADAYRLVNEKRGETMGVLFDWA